MLNDGPRCPFVTAANMRCLLYEGHPDAHDLGILAGAVCVCGTANPEHHYRWCPSLPLTRDWWYPIPSNDFNGRMRRFLDQNEWAIAKSYKDVQEYLADGDTQALIERLNAGSEQRAKIMVERAAGRDTW